MKKYLILLVTALLVCCSNAMAADDYNNLAKRLDSRDFSAEIDVSRKNAGVYTGEILNRHSETFAP